MEIRLFRIKAKYGFCGARIKPNFKTLLFMPDATMGIVVGLMEPMIRRFGKEDNFSRLMNEERGKGFVV